jgi:predicted RNA binding protein YcfA (HicA-like mRNA interferase family)
MPLSGEAMVKLYRKAGWCVLSSSGSHIKMGKGVKREIIPLHKELKKGLERALLKSLREGDEQ